VAGLTQANSGGVPSRRNAWSTTISSRRAWRRGSEGDPNLGGDVADGEQTPGVAYTPEEKLRIARLLDEVHVPMMDVGIPVVDVAGDARLDVLPGPSGPRHDRRVEAGIRGSSGRPEPPRSRTTGIPTSIIGRGPRPGVARFGASPPACRRPRGSVRRPATSPPKIRIPFGIRAAKPASTR